MPEIQFRIVGGRKHTLLAPNVVKVGDSGESMAEMSTGGTCLLEVLGNRTCEGCIVGMHEIGMRWKRCL